MDPDKIDQTIALIVEQQAGLTVKLDRLHEEVQLLARVSLRHDERLKNISDLQDAQQAMVLRLSEMQRENERRFQENERRFQENERRFAELRDLVAETDRMVQRFIAGLQHGNGQPPPKP